VRASFNLGTNGRFNLKAFVKHIQATRAYRNRGVQGSRAAPTQFFQRKKLENDVLQIFQQLKRFKGPKVPFIVMKSALSVS
jgi:hypothetical protein